MELATYTKKRRSIAVWKS